MKIQEIYDKYKIMSRLQLHMLRVAGVSSTIVNNYQKNIDKNSVIVAALLHDMGNIIKFKLDLFPENLKPKGLGYWEKVKHDFIGKYGHSEHETTLAIAKELGIQSDTIVIMKTLKFSDTLKIISSKDIRKIIVKYSDLRVSPFGIMSLTNRLSEAKKRYVDIPSPKWTNREYNELASMWSKAEKQIFAHCKIKPEDITDEKVNPLLENLRNFEIEKE